MTAATDTEPAADTTDAEAPAPAAAAPEVYDGPPLTVVQAIAMVMREIGGIEKMTSAERARRAGVAPSNEKGVPYAYRGIDQIAAAAQPLFGKYGVVFVPKVTSYEVHDIVVAGNPWTDTTMQVEWTIHGCDGSSITSTTIGLGRDNSDKGANKAMTGAFKNVMLRVLCIGDPADDTDGHDPMRDRGTARPQGTQTGPTAPAEPTRPMTPEEQTHARLKDLTDEQKTAVAEVRAAHGGLPLTVKSFTDVPEYRVAVLAAIMRTAAPAPDQPADGQPPEPDAVPVEGGRVEEPGEPGPEPEPDGESTGEYIPDDRPPNPDGPRMSEPQNRRIRALYKESGESNQVEQRRISGILAGVPDLKSHRDLSIDQAAAVIDQLQRINAGELQFIVDGEGTVFGVEPAPQAVQP